MTELKKKLKNKNIKILFTDYYDTLVHRNVHPNQVIRIWSKIMIKELGLQTSIDHLYFTFKEAQNYLAEKLNKNTNEIPYKLLQQEIFIRLNNEHTLSDNQQNIFYELFEKVQLKVEKNVQNLNNEIFKVLEDFKMEGGKIFLISDFYGPKSLFVNLLKHHKIEGVFEDIFISSTEGKSKHIGTLYSSVLSQIDHKGKEVMMIGDNKWSDEINAKNAGINTFLLPHKKYHFLNKKNAIGSDEKLFNNKIKEIYIESQKKHIAPFSEYIFFYHFFVERLYNICRSRKIDSLFFLSREGLFLKRLFDSYAAYNNVGNKTKIRTHYLKISRQASLQIALEPLEIENFKYLRAQYRLMSVNEFLSFFNFSETVKKDIRRNIDFDSDQLIESFFDSNKFDELKSNTDFKKYYDEHRNYNKLVFKEYISSFNENIETNGIHLVDIGWGGTMQESIYHFFNNEFRVTGFYLGLNDIYNLTTYTKRYGLNFSVLPYIDYKCHILRANSQLYEQFSGANHGSCVEYSKSEGNYTIEKHDSNEKKLYKNFIKNHQNDMFDLHIKLLNELYPICYTDGVVDDILIKIKLKSGLLQGVRKIKFLKKLNSGFYQNLSNKKKGIDYEVPKGLINLKSLYTFILKPEEYFKLLVKLNLKLYSTNKLFYHLFPSSLIYVFYKINRYLRFTVFKKFTILKYNFFK